MCTPIPVIYPTLYPQIRIGTRSDLALCRNFSMAVRRSPCGLWSGNRSLYTYFHLPIFLSTTGSSAPPCFKTAWVLSSPKNGSNRATWVLLSAQLVRHWRLQPQTLPVTQLTTQSRRPLIYPHGKAAVTYRARFLMNTIAPYGELGLKARDQEMEEPWLE